MNTKKFKVWCNHHNGWETSPIYMSEEGRLFHLNTGNPFWLKEAQHRVAWNIGKKDHNDNPIFTGHILRHHKAEYKEIYVAISNPFMLRYELTTLKRNAKYCTISTDDLIIVGHIFNKEDESIYINDSDFYSQEVYYGLS